MEIIKLEQLDAYSIDNDCINILTKQFVQCLPSNLRNKFIPEITLLLRYLLFRFTIFKKNHGKN